jgi:hypothetical protein
MKRDVVAGVLLVNTIPHVVMGLFGKRCMTPLGGADSSPGRNLAWAGINLAGATAALVTGRWRTIPQADADQRLATVQFGMFAMALFSACYHVVVGGHRVHPILDRRVEDLRSRSS